MLNTIRKNTPILILMLFAIIVWWLKCPMIFADLDDSSFRWAMTKFAANHWPKDWWYWNHHTARFGTIVPGLLFQSIFGGHAIVSYLPSFTMFLICVAVIFKLSFEKVSSIIFLIFFLTYVLARDMVLHFSQFEVSIFTQAYMLLCFYFICKILEKNDNSGFKIVAASFFFFCAYLAKEDNIFYLPGLVSIFILNKKYKWGVCFLAINLALFLTETSLYASLTQFTWGRASVIIHANHLPRIGLDWGVGDSIWFLFTRFCFVSGNLKILLYFYLISFPLVLFVFKKVMSKDLLQVAFLPLSFYFCITFAVNGINPYRPIMPFEGRFLMSTFPFLTLYCMFLFQNIASNFFENQRYQFFLKRFDLKYLSIILNIFLLILSVRQRQNITHHSLFKIQSQSRQLNDLFNNGATFMAQKDRAIHLFRTFYWEGFQDRKYNLPLIWEGEYQNNHVYLIQKDARPVTSAGHVYNLALEDGVSYQKLILEGNIENLHQFTNSKIEF